MKIKIILTATLLLLVNACKTSEKSETNSSVDDILPSKTGELWLNGSLIAFFAEAEAKKMFTKMNADLEEGKVKLELQNDYGFAKANWQTPNISIDTIKMVFEENLLVTRFDLILPYQWQDRDQEREEEREFTVSIMTKQTFEVRAGIPLLTQVRKEASDLQGGDSNHRQILNTLSGMLKVFNVSSSSEMEAALQKYVDENTPLQGSMGLYDGHIENNNLVYN